MIMTEIYYLSNSSNLFSLNVLYKFCFPGTHLLCEDSDKDQPWSYIC